MTNTPPLTQDEALRLLYMSINKMQADLCLLYLWSEQGTLQRMTLADMEMTAHIIKELIRRIKPLCKKPDELWEDLSIESKTRLLQVEHFERAVKEILASSAELSGLYPKEEKSESKSKS